jgi:hypothetical protein
MLLRSKGEDDEKQNDDNDLEEGQSPGIAEVISQEKLE